MPITDGNGNWLADKYTAEELGAWGPTWLEVAEKFNWNREPTYTNEPNISPDDFLGFDSAIEMAKYILRGNWNSAQGFYVKGSDTVWINQIMGGSEWMVIKQGTRFESISAELVAGATYENGYEPVDPWKLASLIDGINRSTVEQCVAYEYHTTSTTEQTLVSMIAEVKRMSRELEKSTRELEEKTRQINQRMRGES
jgi:hypothetical protein